MSNIDKQWLQHKIADMEAACDEIPFGLDEDDSNTLAAMKLALASLEAEAVAFRSKLQPPTAIGSERWDYTDHRQPDAFELENCVIERLYTAPPAPANAEPVAWLWSHRKHPSEVSLIRPEDDERAEGAHWSGWNCQALYAAPPAPVSVPEWTNEQCLEFLSIAFRHAEIKGDLELDDIRLGVKMANGSRAAILQGAEQQNQQQNILENIPATQFKPVADLYEMQFDDGRTCAFHTDGAKAVQWLLTCDGNKVQEYVKLDRYQETLSGNSPVIPDGWVLVPVEPTMSQEFAGYRTLTDTGKMSRLMKTRLSNIYRAMIAAAPQQEVKP